MPTCARTKTEHDPKEQRKRKGGRGLEDSVIRFEHVSMAFPGVLANDDISL